jgi:hypothetical protein
MGGLRTITGFTNYDVNTWEKSLPDIESRIQTLTVDGTPWTEQTAPTVAGGPIPPIEENKWFLDRYNKILYLNVGNGNDANDYDIQIKTYFTYWGEWGTQTELNNNELFQIFKSNSNISLRYVIIPIFVFGSPALTEIKLEIQSLRNGIPSGMALSTSESSFSHAPWSSNTLYYMYFKFNEYGIREDTDYSIVLKANGAFNASNHVAWGKLDLLYLTGLPTDMNQITEGGSRFAIVGTKL